MFATLLLSLAMLAAAPAAAPTEGTAAPQPAPAAARPAAAAKADPDRIICRRVGIPNSRFTTKNCATAAEWEANAKYARRYTRDIQTAPSACRAAGC